MGSAIVDSSGTEYLTVSCIRAKIQPHYTSILWFFIIATLIWIPSFTLISSETLSMITKNYEKSENNSNFDRENKEINKTAAIKMMPLNSDPETTIKSTAIQLITLSPDTEAIIKSTMKRLEERVEKHRSQKTLYQTKLNQTIPWANGNHVYISHGINDGGLGNWLFMIASLYGVARSNDRIPSLFQSYWAEEYFEDFSLVKISRFDFLGSNDKLAKARATVSEMGAGKYAYWMSDVNLSMGSQNVILSGYLQSWRYFDQFRDEIRSMFVFRKKIFDYALGAIWSELRKFYFNGSTSEEDFQKLPRLVGIHVRRGDITTMSQRRHGHVPAPREYFTRAVAHFRRKYPTVLFLVITNDDEYCKNIFRGKNFMFLEIHHEAVDLAILSLMDDLILSVGSYGWWGAYLSDAHEIVYYRDWPNKGSDMAKAFNTAEYFLPSWTSMV